VSQPLHPLRAERTDGTAYAGKAREEETSSGRRIQVKTVFRQAMGLPENLFCARRARPPSGGCPARFPSGGFLYEIPDRRGPRGTNIAVAGGETQRHRRGGHGPDAAARGAAAVLDETRRSSARRRRARASHAGCAGVGVGCPAPATAPPARCTTRQPRLGWGSHGPRPHGGSPRSAGRAAQRPDCAALGEVLAGRRGARRVPADSRSAPASAAGSSSAGGSFRPPRAWRRVRPHVASDGRRALNLRAARCWEAYASGTAPIPTGGGSRGAHPGSALRSADPWTALRSSPRLGAGDAAAQAVARVMRDTSASARESQQLLTRDRLSAARDGGGRRCSRPSAASRGPFFAGSRKNAPSARPRAGRDRRA
jgi:hypothetical protein